MHPNRTSASEPTGARARSWWLSPRGRALLSVFILLHLLAVLGEPMRMFTQGSQPSAPDARLVRRGLAPYIDFAYLHHGYFFFAPNPGPSHLMDIRLTDADGSVRHLRLPNHRAQWPRLLYHRHFMLSEFLFQLYTPQPQPGELNTPSAINEAWRRDRQLFERVRTSMENHLATRYGAKSAEIQLMEHRLPNAVEVFDQGLALDDEQFYILLPDYPPESDTAVSAGASNSAFPLPPREAVKPKAVFPQPQSSQPSATQPSTNSSPMPLQQPIQPEEVKP